MNRNNVFVLCFLFILFLLQDCSVTAAAFAFSETDFDSSNFDYETTVDNDNSHSYQSPIRYRKLNEVREIRRYYCGINVDCSKGFKPDKRKQVIHQP
ncbi:hypothetical protein WA538_003962 [Blastocystis sp. DL]